jgi:hypothetical protein
MNLVYFCPPGLVEEELHFFVSTNQAVTASIVGDTFPEVAFSTLDNFFFECNSATELTDFYLIRIQVN